MKTKIFTLFLALAASVGPMLATIYSGTCGANYNNLTWSLNTEDSTLVIEGSGAMRDFPWNYSLGGYTTPWYKYHDYIAHVSLSSELTTIGMYAFAECYCLKTITIPENVMSIGANAFLYLHLNSVHISSLSSWCNITFANFDSNPLNSVHHLYLNGTEITDLVIPDDVTNINNFAFAYCECLTSVTLSDSLLSIGKQAFSNCTNVTNVSVGNGVTTIGDQAFKDCSNLTNLIIGASVASIGDKAFENCSNLTSVTLNSNAICSVDYGLMKGVQTIFGTQVQEYIIGESVNSIGENFCSYSQSLTSVSIGNNVIAIGKGAFHTCTNLISVTMGNGVEEIGNLAFANCCKLTSLILSENLSSVGSNVFSLCSLTSVDIPRSLHYIGPSMFSSCAKLKNVTLHDNITSIGKGAFIECDSLNNILIPNSVTEIGDDAFYGCQSLSNILLSNNITHIGNYVFYKCKKLTSIEIPSGVRSIGKYAFAESGLTSIEIPARVQSIGESAFELSGLTSIVIPDSVTTIGNKAFASCVNMTNVMLGNNIDSIGEKAFYVCVELTDINIPVSVKSIGVSAFEECHSLTHIEIPDSVRIIREKTFWNCKNLTNVTIGNNVVTIGNNAFDKCDKLPNIIIPASVTRIGQLAFRGIELRTVTCLGEVPATFENTYNSPYLYPFCATCDSLIVYVPCGALDAYQNSAWNAYDLRYTPSEYNLQVLVKDQIGGTIQKENNSCASSIIAIPEEGYYFVQWSDSIKDNPRIITLTQDTSFTAIFAKQIFTITFVDDNDTILSSQEVEYNTMPIPPADPVKTNDAQYSYIFVGWSPTIVAATLDATYKATYNRTTNQYTITFLNDDNSVLSSQLWDYGVTPTCERPSKEEDENYTYTFNGWTPEIVPVVADAIYTATYEATPKSEGMEDVFGDITENPSKIFENGSIYILMPNGQKYSIVGNQIK